MNDRPTNLDELTVSIREAITNLEQYRDHPDTFTLGYDHDYPEYALLQVMGDARHAGYPSLAQTVPKRVGVGQALKILGRMLEAQTVDHDGPYSAQEAAIITKVSPRKIYYDCASGKLECTRNPYRITKEALEQYQRDRGQPKVKTTGFRHL